MEQQSSTHNNADVADILLNIRQNVPHIDDAPSNRLFLSSSFGRLEKVNQYIVDNHFVPGFAISAADLPFQEAAKAAEDLVISRHPFQSPEKRAVESIKFHNELDDEDAAKSTVSAFHSVLDQAIESRLATQESTSERTELNQLEKHQLIPTDSELNHLDEATYEQGTDQVQDQYEQNIPSPQPDRPLENIPDYYAAHAEINFHSRRQHVLDSSNESQRINLHSKEPERNNFENPSLLIEHQNSLINPPPYDSFAAHPYHHINPQLFGYSHHHPYGTMLDLSHQPPYPPHPSASLLYQHQEYGFVRNLPGLALHYNADHVYSSSFDLGHASQLVSSLHHPYYHPQSSQSMQLDGTMNQYHHESMHPSSRTSLSSLLSRKPQKPVKLELQNVSISSSTAAPISSTTNRSALSSDEEMNRQNTGQLSKPPAELLASFQEEGVYIPKVVMRKRPIRNPLSKSDGRSCVVCSTTNPSSWRKVNGGWYCRRCHNHYMRRTVALLPEDAINQNPENLRTCSKCSTWRNIRWYKNPDNNSLFICGKCYETNRKGKNLLRRQIPDRNRNRNEKISIPDPPLHSPSHQRLVYAEAEALLNLDGDDEQSLKK